jgi:ketosteroid isomerase-like protein
MRTRYLMTLLMLLVALAGCTRTDRTAEEATIRAADAHWLAAAQAHDLERMLSYWTEDVIMMQPGAPAMVGKKAVRRYVSEAFENNKAVAMWR